MFLLKALLLISIKKDNIDYVQETKQKVTGIINYPKSIYIGTVFII